jgi:hypothetical protein
MTPYLLGKFAFDKGITAPALDADFIREYLQDQPSNKHIQWMKDWYRGWTVANLAAPILDTDN